MPTRKKKFIDKKSAVTFRLVHRSQKDPLQADERAPQHVLVENKEKLQKRKEEQSKYGIYFDDDYNYLQHLKDVSAVAEWEEVERYPVTNKEDSKPDIENKLTLPSSVFPSDVEEKTGLLNRAAPNSGPHPEWDPDIVAALDGDFDFEEEENFLEDDFIARANAGGSDDDFTEGQEGDDEMDDENDLDSDGYLSCNNSNSQDGQGTVNEETRSRFTNYSLTSSVMNRNKGLQLLDEQFEKMYEEYDDTEIGPLDADEIMGEVDPSSSLMKMALNDFEEKTTHVKLMDAIEQPVQSIDILNEEAGITDDEAEDDEELVKVSILKKDKDHKWDCESVLSTYSNLYNHPKLITEPSKKPPISVSQTTGIPLDVLGSGLTKSKLKKLNQLNDSANIASSDDEIHSKTAQSRISNVSLPRRKFETPDERKQRKCVVKTYKKERRLEKKSNKIAFKQEAVRQEQAIMNLRQNLQGVKLL